MAKTASMYIRIDPQVKADVEAIYSRYGMSITDAINLFLYASRNAGGLPFDLGAVEDKKHLKLEERIKVLENKLDNISFSEAKEITMTNCPIGDVQTGNDCQLNFESCPIGTVIDSDIDEADSRLDDLECRLDEINTSIDEAEARIDAEN